MRTQLLDEHGIEIMAAFGSLGGKVWRIGLMGYNARPENAYTVLGALERVLTSVAHHRPGTAPRRHGGDVNASCAGRG